MEDGVTEVESLISPKNLNPGDESKREDGFASLEKVEEVKEEDVGAEHTGKDCVAKDEAKGLINNLITTLVTPLSPRIGKATEHESGNVVFKSDDHGERAEVENDGEGGIISNLVYNFFHESEGECVVENEKEKDKEEDEVIIVDERIKRMKTEEGVKDGGGGIIHNIVSHLPSSSSLPGDGVPTADEATILINSIVRD